MDDLQPRRRRRARGCQVTPRAQKPVNVPDALPRSTVPEMRLRKASS
jgi:hypothetical protein